MLNNHVPYGHFVENEMVLENVALTMAESHKSLVSP
jgi:hypothetical protein